MSVLNPHPHPLIDDDAELAALQPRLTSDDAVVRRLALIELAELEDERHAPWLIWALSDHDASVREEAAARLANWEQPDTVEALARALTDEAEPVRRAAAHSLAELKHAESGHLLLPVLAATTDGFTCASILRALRELRLPASCELALKLSSAHEAAVRLEAVAVLGWLKLPPALPLLADVVLRDEDPEVRRAAAGALGYAEGDAALHALAAALRDSAWPVREEAATTLGKLKLQGALEALIASLSDDYWQVRQKAARALGRLKQPRAVSPLIELALGHSSANLRKEAAIALGEIGDPSARPALEAASEDHDPDVRKLARLALVQLAERA